MPELPEVETIRRELDAALPGRRILDVQVRLPKMVKLPVRRFRLQVIGARIKAVHRRAKLLLFHLSNGRTMIIHLKMSGQLIWRPQRGRLRVGGHPIPGGLIDLPNRYSHVIFPMRGRRHGSGLVKGGGGTLFFNDQRQFGFIKIVATADLNTWLEHEGYGPEPLAEEFTLEQFAVLLRRHRKKRVKPMLLDQSVIAGVGNIYADEACFAARVRPTRRVGSLTATERRDLYRGLRAVMNLAIAQKGTTANLYRRTDGRPGGMSSFLKVYGRAGQRCRRCGGTIKKIAFAGRGTHFCPSCQR